MGTGAIELDNWAEGVQGPENTGKLKSRFCPRQPVKEWKDNCFCSERKISILEFRGGSFRSEEKPKYDLANVMLCRELRWRSLHGKIIIVNECHMMMVMDWERREAY